MLRGDDDVVGVERGCVKGYISRWCVEMVCIERVCIERMDRLVECIERVRW